MKMIEIQGTVDKQGQLTIPAQPLRDMGLVSGDTVKLAYISDSVGGISNTFKEFVITPNGIDTLEDEGEDELTLPRDLLDAAQIPPDSDLGIHPDTVREVMRNGGFANE
ncbi:hypothetical protein [Faecalispora anaeroviscerum]|uniref:hypothetical protein n=1 Tax=Faecalispora anaeroviscerum TaxID=2991836 RepID=UPI0024B93A71|nr:hypothetical protein [Faecalispora anaeroviscerum]